MVKIGLLPEIGIAADCLSVLTIRILAAIDAAIFVAQFAVCQSVAFLFVPRAFPVSAKDLRG